MAKKESSFINMVLTLFVVTAIAALALGGVYNVTKEPIAIAKWQDTFIQTQYIETIQQQYKNGKK